MDEKKAKRFVSFLKNKYGEDGAKKKIQKIQKTGKVDDEDLKEFQASEQKQQQAQIKKDAHGAKLNYFRSLKNQCPEGEELYYFKKGGKASVGCGCKKKEDGGQVTTAKEGSAIAKFKATRKMQAGKKIEQKKEGWDNKGNFIISKAGREERRKQLEANKNEEGQAAPKKQETKPQTKLQPKPQPKQPTKKECGGAVAKFKKHRQGGSLNGIPFIRKVQ